MYHDRTYSLLGAVPPSEVAVIPKHLPASMREWYSFPNAIAAASRQDWLRPLHKLEIWRQEESNFLVFMSENLGVCRWAVQLDHDDTPQILADDPEVLVSVELRPFLPYANTFSDHVFCAVWDWMCASFHAGAQAAPLAPDDLTQLSGPFQPLTRTRNWPLDCEVYRFAAAGVRLRLYSHPDQCGWELRSDSEEAFFRAARFLLPLSNLRD